MQIFNDSHHRSLVRWLSLSLHENDKWKISVRKMIHASKQQQYIYKTQYRRENVDWRWTKDKKDKKGKWINSLYYHWKNENLHVIECGRNFPIFEFCRRTFSSSFSNYFGRAVVSINFNLFSLNLFFLSFTYLHRFYKNVFKFDIVNFELSFFKRWFLSELYFMQWQILVKILSYNIEG